MKRSHRSKTHFNNSFYSFEKYHLTRNRMSFRVWSSFQARRSDGSLVKLRIQDLPKSRVDEAAELFIKYFIHEEKFHEAAGTAQNPQAAAESQVMVTESMKDPGFHFMICCADQDNDKDGQIVGVSAMSLMSVGSKSSKETKRATKELQTVFKLLGDIPFHTIIDELRIAHFYDDRGLIVHPQFRKLGIATEFFKARCLACVERNVPATIALMTSIATEKAAEKVGWETAQEVNLEELGHRHGVTLSGVAKLMIWKNQQFKQYHGK